MKTLHDVRDVVNEYKKNLLLLVLFVSPMLVFASHFRYGNISWQNSTGRTVVFKISQAWRRSYFSPTPVIGASVNITTSGDPVSFNFGDGTPNASIILTVTSINPEEDWFYGEATITHTYSSIGNYTASFVGCCRIFELVNNASNSFKVQTHVDVGNGNSSPVSTIIPIIDVPINTAAATFNISAIDPNGSALRYRLSTTSEPVDAFDTFLQPAGLSINNSTGQMTFNTVGKTLGQLYSTQIMISDGVAETALDFIIRISGTPGTPPVFVYPPTPTNGQVITVIAGQPASFTVRAQDVDPGSTVTLSVAGAPIGASFSPALPATGNPVSSVFSWNTTTANIGSFVLYFNAIDNTGRTDNTSVNINVVRSEVYYSKATGNLHNVLTWGLNTDGSGPNPSDFGSGKTFVLANRAVNYNLTANWTIGGILVNPAGSRLQISGFTLSLAEMRGTISGTPSVVGTITGSTTSNLIITGTNGGNFPLNFTPGGGSLNNLTLNRTGTSPSVTVSSTVPLSIYGVLTVTSGALNTSNAVTLKSTATNTARVAPVLGSITGNVTVERYIPARRAWRLMSAPIGGTQTVNQSWQEGVTTASAIPNPNPGYGTHITVGSTANGFDINPVPEPVNYSLRRYQSSTDAWVSVPNTNSTAVNAAPYMLFVRGDRGIALGYRTVAPSNTTLRVTGPLKTGNQTFAVSATGFTAIPNPFASPINFVTITKKNVQNNFYVWDPKMGGTYGVGAYVNVFFNGTSWEVTPSSVSPESQFIQSGQAFLVHSSGGVAGSLVIKESDKSAAPAMNVFRTANTTSTGLRITLKSVGADNITSIHDEVFSSYSNKYSDKVDDIDALKVENMEENLAILKEGKALMVDRKPVIVSEDRIDLKLSQTSADKNYFFEFNPMNLSSSTLSAALVDNYLHTTTPLSLSEISKVTFKTDPQSTNASTRFTVMISSRKAVAPIDIVSQKAGVSILTNPVVGKVINLQFKNLQKGTYRVSMFNTLGQAVYQNIIRHEGGSTTQKVRLSNNLSKGTYQLNVTNGSSKYNGKLLVD